MKNILYALALLSSSAMAQTYGPEDPQAVEPPPDYAAQERAHDLKVANKWETAYLYGHTLDGVLTCIALARKEDNPDPNQPPRYLYKEGGAGKVLIGEHPSCPAVAAFAIGTGVVHKFIFDRIEDPKARKLFAQISFFVQAPVLGINFRNAF